MRTLNRTINNRPGFYENLNHNYGPDTKATAVDYQTCIRREAELKCNLVYLLRCRKQEIPPPFLKKKVDRLFKELLARSKEHKNQIQELKTLLQVRHLSIEIDIAAKQLGRCRNTATNLNFDLHQRLPPDTYQKYMETQKQFGERQYKRNKTRLRTKFDRIAGENLTTMNNIFSTSGVVNLTNLVIPTPILHILSLGPKFALKPRTISIKDGFNLISEIESISRTTTSPDITRQIANECTIALQQTIDNNKKLTKIEYYLHHAYDQTLKFIKEHKNIRIIKTDKTNKVAIMTLEQYQEKMMTHLNDRSTYRAIDFDKTNKSQTSVRKHVNALVVKGIINDGEASELINPAPMPPRIYGSLKDHKSGSPLRIIVSSINSPGQPLAKFVNRILQNVVDVSKYNVGNSADFLGRLKNVKLRPNDIMVSFDVVSLFTCVPLDTAISAAMARWDRISKYTNMPEDLFRSILTFLVKENNYFLYDDTYYEQTNGLPMGGSLSTVLCDFVLEDLFDEILPKLQIQPSCIYKYVDDIFTTLPESSVPETLRLLNNVNMNIQFTVEMEKDGQLAFLDTRLIRKNDSITSDWFRKSTASDRLISFHSAHPYNMKVNIARELINRALKLSDKRFHDKNINICRNILLTNHYPEKLINRLVKRACYVVRNPTTTEQPDSSGPPPMEAPTYRRATYIPGLTDKIKNVVAKYIPNLRLGLKPPMRMDRFSSNLKSQVPNDQRGGGIYMIPCNNSQHCYIGETKRQLGTRINEHTRDCDEIKSKKIAATNHIQTITRTRSTRTQREPLMLTAMNHLKKTAKSSLAAHLIECDHDYNFSAAKMIHPEPRYYSRKLIESLYIQLNENSAVNSKRETNNLTPAMKVTICKLQKSNSGKRNIYDRGR